MVKGVGINCQLLNLESSRTKDNGGISPLVTTDPSTLGCHHLIHIDRRVKMEILKDFVVIFVLC